MKEFLIGLLLTQNAFAAITFNDLAPGDCFTSLMIDKSPFSSKAYIKDNANMLLAKKGDYGLVAQAIPDCIETFENTYKCGFWIRSETKNDFFALWLRNSIKVKCPPNVSITKILKNASEQEKQVFNLDEI